MHVPKELDKLVAVHDTRSDATHRYRVGFQPISLGICIARLWESGNLLRDLEVLSDASLLEYTGATVINAMWDSEEGFEIIFRSSKLDVSIAASLKLKGSRRGCS